MFNEIGQCVGIAFQSMAGGDAENIGYVIPTPVINHFLTDFKCVLMTLIAPGVIFAATILPWLPDDCLRHAREGLLSSGMPRDPPAEAMQAQSWLTW